MREPGGTAVLTASGHATNLPSIHFRHALSRASSRLSQAKFIIRLKAMRVCSTLTMPMIRALLDLIDGMAPAPRASLGLRAQA
ncbi:hypothetical protein D3227_13475 [Mesorhizobium waimense]|uniref:Uncharacterized protein n=1 Tax=Mesorhizobium waimense TaxID=1300307 RepID=A0A3A5KV04_9HYPH|nr:hypothetical protein D3227_13475 [Mesorhizobium waimense]